MSESCVSEEKSIFVAFFLNGLKHQKKMDSSFKFWKL